MLLNVLFMGLLGLASSPLQSIVTARAVGDYTTPQVRDVDIDLTARDWDWPTLKMSDISAQVQPDIAKTVDVTGEKGKEVLNRDRVYVKTKGNPKQELKVYKDIEGEDIALEILAVIVKGDDDDEAVGFVMPAADEARKAGPNDLAECREVLEKLHDKDWLHMDPNKSNYMFIDGKWLAFDFEDSLKVDDEKAFSDFDDGLDDDGRKNMDFAKQGASFGSGLGWAKKN